MPENPDYQPWTLGGPLCRIYDDVPVGRRRCVIDEEITASYLKSLPNLSNMTELDVERSSLSDDAMEFLARQTQTEILKFTFCRLSEIGLCCLGAMTWLKKLCLTDAQLTDARLVHLSSLTQ